MAGKDFSEYVGGKTFDDILHEGRRESADRILSEALNAIAAHTAGCTTIVAYDEHFRAIEATIPYKTPDEIVAEYR